jgi:hypothetical protein
MGNEVWANAHRIRARQVEKLRQQLMSPPQRTRPFPKPWPIHLADFTVGEIIGRRLQSGKLAVAKVIGFRRSLKLKVRGPAVRLQKWVSEEIPNASEASELEFLRYPIGPNRIQTIGAPVLTASRRKPLDPSQFIRPDILVPLRDGEDKCSYFSVAAWPPYSLDEIFEAAIERWWDDPNLPASAPPPWYKPSAG